jgi:hypothetical protein
MIVQQWLQIFVLDSLYNDFKILFFKSLLISMWHCGKDNAWVQIWQAFKFKLGTEFIRVNGVGFFVRTEDLVPGLGAKCGSDYDCAAACSSSFFLLGNKMTKGRQWIFQLWTVYGPWGRFGVGPPAGRRRVGHGGPWWNFRESMATPLVYGSYTVCPFKLDWPSILLQGLFARSWNSECDTLIQLQ